MTTSQQPAYPTNNSHAQQSDGQTGLTKLELLSGLALAGLLANPSDEVLMMSDHVGFNEKGLPDPMVATAVSKAEALCAELDKRKENQ